MTIAPLPISASSSPSMLLIMSEVLDGGGTTVTSRGRACGGGLGVSPDVAAFVSVDVEVDVIVEDDVVAAVDHSGDRTWIFLQVRPAGATPPSSGVTQGCSRLSMARRSTLPVRPFMACSFLSTFCL